jgi:protein-tyrosine kinase
MNAVRDVNDTGAAAPVGWPLGVLLVRAGRMTELDVSRVLVAQREQNVQFGVAAQRLGLVTQEDVQRALALQFGYAYPPVDDCVLDASLVTFHHPTGPEAEAMRTLRGQLMLQCAAGQKKIVALLSPHSAEDASFLAGNLAIAFAQLDRHTLLIDANLRNPTQHTRFGIAGREGLSSVLARGIPFLESLARVTSLANLAILPAGPIPPNPHELLSSDRFTDLLDTAKSRFDCIIVDTSPLLETTDGQMVAARAGSCVVVVRRQEQVANIERVKTLIKAAGADLIGAVLR